MSRTDFERFLRITLPEMGYDWRRLNRRNVRRRVFRHMESLGIHDLSRYEEILKTRADERDVFDSLLRVTITRFFRNIATWQALERTLIHLKPDAVRAWSAGCAGGEEAFSLAMLLTGVKEAGLLPGGWSILATDTDRPSLGRSAGTRYDWGSVREVPEDLRRRYFTVADGRWNLDDGIRKRVRFLTHDVVREEPPGIFNLVLLRNSVLTYNTAETRSRVLGRVREHLETPGLLVIGRTEKLPATAGFERLAGSIYRKGKERGTTP